MEKKFTVTLGNSESRPSGITIKSSQELRWMREAGYVVAQTKAALVRSIAPGMKTRELDAIASRQISKMGARPSFKGYRGFPATICVSVNDQIVHGIPGNRVIREGDIVSMDVGAIVEGFQGDSAVTVGVGTISLEAQRLIDATREALEIGIQQALPGYRVGDISWAIQQYSETLGYGVVREYVGHGIGRALHEEPSVPNFGDPGRGPLLEPGMAIAIEPMLNFGSKETKVLEDDWTVVTADGGLSAHFEHTVAITERGPEVLTTLEN